MKYSVKKEDTQVANIYTSADQLIGKTPLLELKHIEENFGLKAKIIAKLEYFNPAAPPQMRRSFYDTGYCTAPL